MTVFWTILTKLTFSWIINEIYVNILIFVHCCTHNAPRIPKIYNIIGIWSTDQKLLTVKPIATLRSTTKLNEMKWKKNGRRGDERYMTKVIYQWNKKRWGAQDIWRPDWLTEWMTEWQSTKDVVILISLYSWTTNV